MSFSPPVLTEEEDTLYGSKFLTDDLKCDGCLAISHQLHESFMKKYDNRPASLGLLSQSDVIELAGTWNMLFWLLSSTINKGIIIVYRKYTYSNLKYRPTALISVSSN